MNEELRGLLQRVKKLYSNLAYAGGNAEEWEELEQAEKAIEAYCEHLREGGYSKGWNEGYIKGVGSGYDEEERF